MSKQRIAESAPVAQPAPSDGPTRADHCPRVGRQVRRWRTDRAMTLAKVSEASGLNIGYLSQIENDKAVPSLEALASLATALDVPIGWFNGHPASA